MQEGFFAMEEGFCGIEEGICATGELRFYRPGASCAKVTTSTVCATVSPAVPASREHVRAISGPRRLLGDC
jgi:hypothetical protein